MSPRNTWIALGLALTVVLAVMGWVTMTLLDLDAARIRSEREAVLEEQARLALWRIDSSTTPILSREAAALDLAVSPAASGSLPDPPAGVVLRFVLTQDALHPLTRNDPERLATLERALVPEELFARLAAPGTATVARGLLDGSDAGGLDDEVQPVVQQSDTPYALKAQSLRNEDEWVRRKANVEDNLIAYNSLSNSLRSEGAGDEEVAFGDATTVPGDGRKGNEPEDGDGAYRFGAGPAPASWSSTSVIEPIWIGEHLLLLRRHGPDRIEGSWLDWPALEGLLLAEVSDLLPDARLIPVPSVAPGDTQRLLATLPARLDPGATIPPPPGWSPLRASLLTGWLIVLAAFGAMIALVKVSLALSERRAAFVSAVTHELRTPLTTFRMYTEMLSEGMVEHKRERYLATLRREADRLSGLVENVLAYARIESDRGVRHAERISVNALVDRVSDRLRERCDAAQARLELDTAAASPELAVEADPAAVEQILFNLVDNATKYAAVDDEPRIHVRVEISGRRVELHVRDFGPGIETTDRARIFEPFTKARVDASGTKPGVGLGLALSRQLARQMGGDLALVPCSPGADFVLSLPVARR